MSNDIVRAAIEKRLVAWAKAQMPPIYIAFENVAYEPTVGKSYLAGILLPADTVNPSVGGGHSEYIGVYQVSVYTEAGKGSTAASALVNSIVGLFQVPTTITQGGINVHFDNTPSAARGRPDDNGFWMIPVTIRYRAHVFS